MSNHIGFEELLEYAQGALTRERAAQVYGHCQECAECGSQLGTMMLVRSDVLGEHGAPSRWKQLATAAAIVLVAGIGTAAFFALRGSDPAPGPGPGRPGFEVSLARLATKDPVSREYWAYRFGGATPPTSEEQFLSDALEALVDNDPALAIDILEPWLAENPSNLEGRAYLGIALYLADDHSDRTADLLVSGTEDTHGSRPAAWYLANLRLMRGERDLAAEQLNSLAEVPDVFGIRARRLIVAFDQPPR